MRPKAVFLGWQEVWDGEPIALYNVEGGRLNHSTVTQATLKREGIVIPKAGGDIYKGIAKRVPGRLET